MKHIHMGTNLHLHDDPKEPLPGTPLVPVAQAQTSNGSISSGSIAERVAPIPLQSKPTLGDTLTNAPIINKALHNNGTTPPPPPPSKTKSSGTGKKILKVIVVLLVLGALGFGGYYAYGQYSGKLSSADTDTELTDSSDSVEDDLQAALPPEEKVYAEEGDEEGDEEEADIQSDIEESKTKDKVTGEDSEDINDVEGSEETDSETNTPNEDSVATEEDEDTEIVVEEEAEVNDEDDETQPSTEPLSPGSIDSDGDSLLDYIEERIGTDPYNPDTDGDGVLDYDELQEGTDPLIMEKNQ